MAIDGDELVHRLLMGKMPADKIVGLLMEINELQKITSSREGIEAIVDDIAARQKVVMKPTIQGRVEDFVTFVTNQAPETGFVTFTLTDCYNHLGIRDPGEKVACRMAIMRMSAKSLLEATGKKTGQYRVVRNTDRYIDLAVTSDLDKEIDLKFPLGVHKWIRPFPHTVFIIAGETDTGKSGFLLNFAKENTENGCDNRVHYHSSEMGKAEFLDRTQHFWPDVGSNKKVRFYERSCDFEEAIKRFPNDIHIIDYLQMFTDFFLMAEKIDNIGKALDKGIVFIAIQKPKGRDEGLGGERTKDLSRLYLSMSPGKLKIVKAKNWRDPMINPNNLEISFKLVKGCKFIAEGDWTK